jgi:chromate transport protein ChrA
VVTFGGAYSVLSYIAQKAVEVYGWLQPGEMIDGLGMCESTPGPLIQVVQFVGFLGAHREPGALSPLTAALLASVLVTWVTYAPCFLWIFVGAPYVEALGRRPALSAALSTITAAVVGVVLNLGLWFALHALFADPGERHLGRLRYHAPDLGTVNLAGLVIALVAAALLLRFHVGMLKSLGICALLGIGASWLGLGSGCSASTDAAASSEPEAGARPGPADALGFDRDPAGALPAGWRTGGTHQQGPLASWAIVADPSAPTPPNVLALTESSHGSGSTYNLCWNEALRFHEGALELAVRADRGEEDQGGGPMWRVQDEDDYYVCRVNPLESNFRVYYVANGERKQLASAKVEVATGTWHRIRVEHEGQRIRCALDGAWLLEATDAHLPEAGGVGLWTKADAATSFDDLRVLPR